MDINCSNFQATPNSIYNIHWQDTGREGRGGLSPNFTNWEGGMAPFLQRRQLYTWVSDSQYSVKMLHCVNSLVAAISIYTN